MNAHDTLRSAIDLAIQGQNETIQAVTECDDPHQKSMLVRVSGLFNKLARDIYTELEREPNDDDGSD